MAYDRESKPIGDVAEFIHKAVKRFNKADSNEAKNRGLALDDIQFRKGDQWPEQVKAQRTLDNRPCLTINKINGFVHHITNDQRQNRPAINISPIGDRSDPETAKILKGLIRQIERQSNADIAFDTGFDSAVTMGWGYWRIQTDYEDEDTFDQIVKISSIGNPFTVYLDPDSVLPDGSDAKWVFISDLMLREEFEEVYPDADQLPWQEGGPGDEWKSWMTPTHIRIAEYFYTDTEYKDLVALENGHIGFEEDLDDAVKDRIKSNPDIVIERREVPCQYIKHCKLTARDILEENDWPGKHIPIVKVVGDAINHEGKIQYSGIVRFAKDAQRMYNFWVTSETELIALAPKAPWVMEEGQVEGHEQRWREANNKSLPYLLYKGTNIGGKPAPPPQRQPFAGPPAGVVQAKMSAAQDMQATTGIRFDATLQERNYDESGKALRELKRIGDIANFHYIDNLSRSLKHTGKILIDLIPKIYDTPRILTILREDGSEEKVKVDPTLGKSYAKGYDSSGRLEKIFNPKLGEYDVTVTIGPSYATRRQESAESMLNFMKYFPQAAPLIGDLVARNMDWPGSDEIYSRLASILPPHLQNKQLEMLPPEARALVASVMQQMQQTKAERDQAVAMLGDKEKDRAIERQALVVEREAIAKDFEAKMAKIMADMETKLAVAEAKMGAQRPGMAEAELMLKLEKIDMDFSAKIAKITADNEIKLIQLAQKKDSEVRRDDIPNIGKLAQAVETVGHRIEQQSDKHVLAALAKGMDKLVERLSKPRKKKGNFAGKIFEITEE